MAEEEEWSGVWWVVRVLDGKREERGLEMMVLSGADGLR